MEITHERKVEIDRILLDKICYARDLCEVIMKCAEKIVLTPFVGAGSGPRYSIRAFE